MNPPNEEHDDMRSAEQPQNPTPVSPVGPGAAAPPAAGSPGAAGWSSSQTPGAATPPPGYTGQHVSGPQPMAGWSNLGARDPRRKSALLAVLLSAMPGLGQVYIGSYRRGFINILVIAALVTLLANDMGPVTPLVGLGLAFYWLYNMIDAGRRATYYNMRLQAEAGAVFPEDIDFENAGGSRAGGVVLMVLGFLFLMNTRYRWDFDWIEEWWPLGFMFLGAYLIYKDMQARKVKDRNSDSR